MLWEIDPPLEWLAVCTAHQDSQPVSLPHCMPCVVWFRTTKYFCKASFSMLDTTVFHPVLTFTLILHILSWYNRFSPFSMPCPPDPLILHILFWIWYNRFSPTCTMRQGIFREDKMIMICCGMCLLSAVGCVWTILPNCTILSCEFFTISQFCLASRLWVFTTLPEERATVHFFRIEENVRWIWRGE